MQETHSIVHAGLGGRLFVQNHHLRALDVAILDAHFADGEGAPNVTERFGVFGRFCCG